MIIEEQILAYLAEKLTAPVYMETPAEAVPREYHVLIRTGSGRNDHIDHITLAAQSISADSLYRAAQLNEEMKAALDEMPDHIGVYSSKLNSDYNYTDTQTKKYRYQAVYEIYF